MKKFKDAVFSVFIYIVAWLIFNIFVGLLLAGMTTNCNTDFNRRLEYVFPAHVIGCWLIEDLDVDKKSE